MKLIFNSDLLFANSLIADTLPNKLKEFLLRCKEHANEHEIIIPLTTLLEFERKQNEFVEKEITELQNAKEQIEKYNIKIDEFDSKELVKIPDLIALVENIGISCRVEKPSNEDYENAHQKACLKESPCPPDQKSDEMRDIIIWEIANRIANENGGAILLSRDKIHTHHRGDKDASKVNLIRCNSFERAYEALSIETASAKKIKSLLGKMRHKLIESELPIHGSYQIISIIKPKFINIENGTTKASCKLILSSGTGQDISAKMSIEFFNKEPFYVHFTEIIIDGKNNNEDIIIESERQDILDTKYHSQFKKLKRIIKD